MLIAERAARRATSCKQEFGALPLDKQTGVKDLDSVTKQRRCREEDFCNEETTELVDGMLHRHDVNK